MRLTTHTDPGLTQAGSSSARVRALEISIAADKALVAEVRHSVRATLASWGAGAIADDMAVVASELASNALKHAGGEATVRLRLVEGQALLEVDDSSMQRPVARRGGAEVEEGRGLFLVQALAAEWGWRYRQGGGKTVWASLPAPAGCAA
ncbi:ATP-binding protein [Streptomyces sp. b94]|uniref:ATP-binding protein n=1 Tax=Streptomyces sp. b94 TaxID=1827634 RepID=UPI001B374569|nr:ATP-binding protein [Streptomyces sp. b94]MBQ1096638.1 ATP-binding protein [Streptomyces sp. b94]